MTALKALAMVVLAVLAVLALCIGILAGTAFLSIPANNRIFYDATRTRAVLIFVAVASTLIGIASVAVVHVIARRSRRDV